MRICAVSASPIEKIPSQMGVVPHHTQKLKMGGWTGLDPTWKACPPRASCVAIKQWQHRKLKQRMICNAQQVTSVRSQTSGLKRVLLYMQISHQVCFCCKYCMLVWIRHLKKEKAVKFLVGKDIAKVNCMKWAGGRTLKISFHPKSISRCPLREWLSLPFIASTQNVIVTTTFLSLLIYSFTNIINVEPLQEQLFLSWIIHWNLFSLYNMDHT